MKRSLVCLAILAAVMPTLTRAQPVFGRRQVDTTNRRVEPPIGDVDGVQVGHSAGELRTVRLKQPHPSGSL